MSNSLTSKPLGSSILLTLMLLVLVIGLVLGSIMQPSLSGAGIVPENPLSAKISAPTGSHSSPSEITAACPSGVATSGPMPEKCVTCIEREPIPYPYQPLVVKEY